MAHQRGIVTTLLPMLAAFVVALVALLAARHGLAGSPIYVLVASLLTFLPGGTLATATVELAYGDVVSGGDALRLGAAAAGVPDAGHAGGRLAGGLAAGDAAGAGVRRRGARLGALAGGAAVRRRA